MVPIVSMAKSGVSGRREHRAADPDAHLFPLHVAASLELACHVVHALARQDVAALLGDVAHEEPGHEQCRHHREQRPPLVRAVTSPAPHTVKLLTRPCP